MACPKVGLCYGKFLSQGLGSHHGTGLGGWGCFSERAGFEGRSGVSCRHRAVMGLPQTGWNLTLVVSLRGRGLEAGNGASQLGRADPAGKTIFLLTIY